MPNKQPNYLATQLEQQAAKGAALPESVNKKLHKLFDYTVELKSILSDSLPTEILNTLLVVDFNNQELTLAVNSQTAANHLMYLNKPLTALIASQSLTFNTLNHIKVIVMSTPIKGCQSLVNQSNNTSLESTTNDARIVKNTLKNPSANPIHMGLTPRTKQTITQTIEHVILDEALKKSLKKLFE